MYTLLRNERNITDVAQLIGQDVPQVEFAVAGGTVMAIPRTGKVVLFLNPGATVAEHADIRCVTPANWSAIDPGYCASGCSGQGNAINTRADDWRALGYTPLKGSTMPADAQASVIAAKGWDINAVQHLQITPVFIHALGLHPHFTFKHNGKLYVKPITLIVENGVITRAEFGKDARDVEKLYTQFAPSRTATVTSRP